MEDYNLTWTQHGEESFRAFVDLRAGSSHVDVLLFCGDDTLEAHKVILAACSSYFERLLNAVANDYSRYTIVALARMDPYLLRLAVNFMYSGKVTVPCDRLEEFMSLADLLEVRGLKANPEHGIASFGKRMNPMKRKASAQMLSGESHSKVPAAMSDSKPGTSQSDVMDPEMDPGCELEIKEEPNSSSMDDGFVAVESEEYVEDDFGGLSDVPGNIPPAFLKQNLLVSVTSANTKRRKYDDSYVSYGFTFMTEPDGTQKPQCFLCGTVLANGSMKPAKLKRHLSAMHPENFFDSMEIFQEKKARFEKKGSFVLSFSDS